jgi:hypothetical protein
VGGLDVEALLKVDAEQAVRLITAAECNAADAVADFSLPK